MKNLKKIVIIHFALISLQIEAGMLKRIAEKPTETIQEVYNRWKNRTRPSRTDIYANMVIVLEKTINEINEKDTKIKTLEAKNRDQEKIINTLNDHISKLEMETKDLKDTILNQSILLESVQKNNAELIRDNTELTNQNDVLTNQAKFVARNMAEIHQFQRINNKQNDQDMDMTQIELEK